MSMPAQIIDPAASSEISEEIAPQPQTAGVTAQAVLLQNKAFIRQCHERNIPVIEIGQLLKIKASKGTLYSMFSQAKVGRGHMGFARLLSAQKQKHSEKTETFKAQVKPHDGPVTEYLRKNAALIEAMHHADMTVDNMAAVMGLSCKKMGMNLCNARLNRLHFGLLPLGQNHLRNSYAPREWSNIDDAHVKRGHYCGIAAVAVGAVCRRSGLEISQRARALGLGAWPAELPARERQRLAAAYDARHDLSALDCDNIERRAGGMRGPNKTANQTAEAVQ